MCVGGTIGICFRYLQCACYCSGSLLVYAKSTNNRLVARGARGHRPPWPACAPLENRAPGKGGAPRFLKIINNTPNFNILMPNLCKFFACGAVLVIIFKYSYQICHQNAHFLQNFKKISCGAIFINRFQAICLRNALNCSFLYEF